MTRRVLVAAASGLLGLMLAGCGAGQTAPTSQQVPSIPGVNAQAGPILVRNALVPFDPLGYAVGSDVPVELWIFNDGTAPVRLVEVWSTAARSVTVLGGGPLPALAPGDFVAATVQLTGLTETFSGLGTVPVSLTFDSGAELALEVPMSPPDEPVTRAPRVVEEEEH